MVFCSHLPLPSLPLHTPPLLLPMGLIGWNSSSVEMFDFAAETLHRKWCMGVGGVGEWGVEGEKGGVDNKGSKGGSWTVQLK